MEEMSLFDKIQLKMHNWKFQGYQEESIKTFTLKEICRHIEEQEARIASLEAERGE